VTMDSHGNSQHAVVEDKSKDVLAGLMHKS